jgi:hypothetical protein
LGTFVANVHLVSIASHLTSRRAPATFVRHPCPPPSPCAPDASVQSVLKRMYWQSWPRLIASNLLKATYRPATIANCRQKNNTKVPYMVSHGNHEDSSANLAHYVERFRNMPCGKSEPPTFATEAGSGASNSMFYSWDAGLVRSLFISMLDWSVPSCNSVLDWSGPCFISLFCVNAGVTSFRFLRFNFHHFCILCLRLLNAGSWFVLVLFPSHRL